MEKQYDLYVCAENNCGATFRRPDHLLYHLDAHVGDRPFICAYDDCMKSYTSASHLKRHEATHEQSNLNFRCPYEECNTNLKTKQTLKKHVRNFHVRNSRTYKCLHCEKVFNKRSCLKIHEYSHTKLKPYICTKKGCDKSFLTPSKLKRHLKVHEGRCCEFVGCDKVCPNWSLLRKHVKISHSKEHKCGNCQKVFTSSWNLKLHMKTHLTERPLFTCPRPNCPRFYTEERNLRTHILNYHEKRPFHCLHDGCHSAFKEKEQLEKHKKDHDPNVPLPSKKRKKKSKKLKDETKSLAAKLAGYDADTSEITSKIEVISPAIAFPTHEAHSITVSSDDGHGNTKRNHSKSCEMLITNTSVDSQSSSHESIGISLKPRNNRLLNRNFQYVTQINKTKSTGDSDENLLIEILLIGSMDKNETLPTDVDEKFSNATSEMKYIS